jgi:ATP-binding cassette subfamily B protein
MKYISQKNDHDCGPACLAMIGSCYNNNTYTLEDISNLINVIPNGASIKNLVAVSSKMGLSGIALKGDIECLAPDIPTPFIAHIKKDDNFHYIVVERINKNELHICDPDRRLHKYKLKISEFNYIWTGYMIIFSHTFHGKKIILSKTEQ